MTQYPIDAVPKAKAVPAYRPVLDGMGNVEEFRTDYAGGYVGMAMRFFDAETRLWSIYWADSRRCGATELSRFNRVLRRQTPFGPAQESRFRSREDNPFGERMLAALRNQFGGHAVKQAQ